MRTIPAFRVEINVQRIFSPPFSRKDIMKNYSVLAGMFLSMVVILVTVSSLQSSQIERLKKELDKEKTEKVMFIYTNASTVVYKATEKPVGAMINYGQLIITNYGQIILPNGQVVQP